MAASGDIVATGDAVTAGTAELTLGTGVGEETGDGETVDAPQAAAINATAAAATKVRRTVSPYVGDWATLATRDSAR